MKISIVTISFNQAEFLERAICSVVEQDHEDIEYIVVDPGSTDGSREIIERYRNRISKVIFEPDNGPADGLNKGFSTATGDVLGFINADDALLPGTLNYVANYFLEYKRMDVLLGAGFVIDEFDNVLRRILPSDFSIRRYVTGGFEFIQQGMFFRQAAFLATGGFNTDNRTSWDGELLLDMGLAGKRVGRCDENLGLFRIHNDSISGSGRLNEAYERDQARLFKKVMGRERRKIDDFSGLLYRFQKVIRAPLFYWRRMNK